MSDFPKTVKPAGAELVKLKGAARLLKAANEALAIAKKQSETAKEAICTWLKEARAIEIETLPIGEMIILEGVCVIERSSQNRFDEKGFMLAEPEAHARWKKDLPVNRYKPLV